jgi:flagellar hook-associated protein 3 FlgL
MRVDPYFAQKPLGALNAIQAKEDQLIRELSSGTRVTQLSDDPQAIAQDLRIRAQQAADTSFMQAAATTMGRMQLVDSVMGSAVSQLTQAISLTTSGANGTLSAANRQAIASQLDGVRAEMLNLANTTYLGRSLFAGSLSGTTAFSLDTSTSPATVTYHGDSDVLTQQTPSGGTAQISISGDRVFGAAGADVFPPLSQAIADLNGAASPAALAADMAALNTSLNRLTSVRASFDAGITRMQAAVTYTQSEQTQLLASEDTLIGTDTASVATDLKNAETQQSALLNVMAQLGTQNLFNYLK